MTSRVVLVEDHEFVREGLRELLSRESDLEVVGEADEPAKAVAVCGQTQAHVAIVDLSLGHASGLGLVADLRKKFPDLRILVLSMHDEHVFAERSIRSGANGYVMKTQSAQVIIGPLRSVLRGRVYVSEAISERMLQAQTTPHSAGRKRTGLERLSNRELEVLRFIGQGHRPKAIAASLGIAVKTVNTHCARMKEKLGLESASQLAITAVHWLRDGFLDGRTEGGDEP